MHTTRLPRKIPPFAALRAFEAAARHCNLRKASEELFLSVSAISHQVKSLERCLGVRLFTKGNNGLALTPNGRLYARALGESFDLLSAATSRIAGERNLASLTIHMFPSLAVLWFMPQLSSWYERAPHVEITVATSIEAFSAPPQRGEFVIGYEERKWVRPAAIVLFDEKIYPVCSPAYAAEYGSRAEGITQESTTLIQCQTAPEEWRHWFEAVDGAGVPPHRILNVDNRALALQAAASGLGIAMGRTPFAQQSIREGRLCRLFDRSQDSGYVYTLKVADGGKQSRVEKDFTAWLIEIAAASRE